MVKNQQREQEEQYNTMIKQLHSTCKRQMEINEATLSMHHQHVGALHFFLSSQESNVRKLRVRMRAIEVGMYGPVGLPTLPLRRAVTEVSGLMEQSSSHKYPHTPVPGILAAPAASSVCGAQGQLEGH